MKYYRKRKLMIRLFLILGILFYLGVYVIYPNVKFDTTPPSINLLAKQANGKYILNINETNIIKVEDDFNLKNIVVYISNKDTKDKFIKVYFDKIEGKEFALNLNKTMLKNILSSYISTLKIKVAVTDNSFAKNMTERIFEVALDNKKPLIKVLNKSLFSLNEGSLIGLKLKASDKESDIDKIVVNGKENYTILDKRDSNYDLLIPVDTEIVKTKRVHIEVSDTVGNKSDLKTYFLTKSLGEQHKIDPNQNALNNFLENLKITLERKNISIPMLYGEDVETIDNVITKISKETKAKSLKTKTFSDIENPVWNNDKKSVINLNDTVFFGEVELKTYGDFYLANKYQDIINPLDGEVVFIGKLNTLGNTIIIKNKKQLYTVFGLLKTVNEKIKVGESIKKGTKIGLPDYSNLFESNFYFSVNINNNYVKPYYFFNSNLYENLLNVFDKGKK